MPSISIPFLQTLRADYREYPLFIETGTYVGDTIFSMEPHFRNLFTIELSEKYYNSTRSKYKGNKISFIHGDSSTKLIDVFSSVSEPSIIFLDGHWSSGDTAKGTKDCPLIEEISVINTHCKSKAIIIIDDRRLFGKNKTSDCNEDWSSINDGDILHNIKARVTDVYLLDSEIAKDDRMIIHIDAI